MRIDVETRGIQEVRREFAGLAARAADFRPAFEAVEELFERNQRSWFASRGKGSWAQLSASTRAQKRKKGQSGKTLVATGALYDSLTGSSRYAVRRQSRDRLVFGTSVPYARFHQYGTTRMPARPPVAPSTVALERAVSRVVREYLETRG